MAHIPMIRRRLESLHDEILWSLGEAFYGNRYIPNREARNLELSKYPLGASKMADGNYLINSGSHAAITNEAGVKLFNSILIDEITLQQIKEHNDKLLITKD